MILRVIGSGEIVEQVFWLDARTRTCGVKLRHPTTGYERCSETTLANLEGEKPGYLTRIRNPRAIENAVGAQAGVILETTE